MKKYVILVQCYNDWNMDFGFLCERAINWNCDRANDADKFDNLKQAERLAHKVIKRTERKNRYGDSYTATVLALEDVDSYIAEQRDNWCNRWA